jgi:hypothetical protein
MANNDFMGSPSSYRDFCLGTTSALFQLMYEARATHALLDEARNRTDGERDETLTGVSFMLGDIERRCKDLATKLSGSEYAYVDNPSPRKIAAPARSVAQGANHG